MTAAFSVAVWGQGITGQAAAGPQAAAPTTPLAASTSQLSPEQRAEAYYQFMAGHRDEILSEAQANDATINGALEHFRQAMHADAGSAYLPQRMAELLFRSGRTGDAIRLAQSVVKEHPDNADAHELLGQMYLRLLGDDSDKHAGEMLALARSQYQALVHLRPNDADHWLILGRLDRMAGQDKDAERELRTSYRLDPASDEAVINLIYVYAQQNRLADAHALIQQVAGTAPAGGASSEATLDALRVGRLYAALGSAYQHQKQYGPAVDAFRQAAVNDPRNLDYRQELAETLVSGGHLPEALTQYRQLAAAEPRNPQILLHLSQVQRRMGLFQEAEASLDAAQKLEPGSSEVGLYAASLYAAEGKPDKAAATLHDILQKTGRSDHSYSGAEIVSRAALLKQYGALERKLGNTAGAVSAYIELESLGGDQLPLGASLLADTYREARQYDQAEKILSAALQAQPDDPGLRLSYGTLLADLNRLDDGLGEIRKTLRGDASDREIYLLIGQLDQRAHRWADANTAANKALQLAGTDGERVESLYLLGGIADSQKQYAQAENFFHQALALEPHNSMVLNYLGYMLSERGERLPEALSYIQQALEKDPNNGAYLDSLGWVYFKLNRLADASVPLKRAAELKQDDPVVLDHLAQVLYRSGRLKEAESAWQRSLNAWQHATPADYDAQQATEVGRRLEDLRIRLAKAAGSARP